MCIVDRLDAERDVQPNLDLEAVNDNDYPLHPESLVEMKEFFLPSLAIIKGTMRRLDTLTDEVADIALTNRGVYEGPYGGRTLAQELGHRLGDAFDIWGGDGPGQGFPKRLLGVVSESQAALYGAQTYLRLQQADQTTLPK